jgi:thiol-disulfide isomerase/thioredoxin
MNKTVIGTLIAIILVGSVLLLDRSIRLNRPVPNNTQNEVEKIIPKDLKLQNFPTKETVTLAKFENKAILINFWASWCEACMAEMPSIQKLYDTLKSDGFIVVSVNVDDNPDKVIPPIVDKMHLSFPIFTDRDGELSKYFDVMAIPFSVMIGKDSKVVWSEAGERDWASDSVIMEIRKILDKKL